MNDYLNSFFLGYLPYIALAVFFFGVWTHWHGSNATVQATSSQFFRKDRKLLWGSVLFHYAILLVLLGHIFGLLMPPAAYRWLMTDETKRSLAIVMGSLSGLGALIGLTMLVTRRFTDKRVRINSSFQDYFIAILLWVQILLGLMGTYHTAHAPLANYLSLDEWAQGVVRFDPDAWKYIASVNIVYKLHIINGFFIFILFPYSKLMHMVAAPIRYVLQKKNR